MWSIFIFLTVVVIVTPIIVNKVKGINDRRRKYRIIIDYVICIIIAAVVILMNGRFEANKNNEQHNIPPVPKEIMYSVYEDRYLIPREQSEEFITDFPEAKVVVIANGIRYDIPPNELDSFFFENHNAFYMDQASFYKQMIYNELSSKGIEMGTYDEYTSALKDHDNLEWIYAKSTEKGLNVGTYQEFVNTIMSVPEVAPYLRRSSKFPKRTSHNTSKKTQLIIEPQIENALITGDRPYANYYGSNSHGDCSITVTASSHHDVVVVIKDRDEIVVSHAYIEKGDTYSFSLSPGEYQVFFYSGLGWKSSKKMSDGLYGGFTKQESFSKSGYERLRTYEEDGYIYYSTLTFVLNRTTSGNFRPHKTSRSELFK